MGLKINNIKLPSGYTQLEYLESSGAQYIDTGLTVNSTDIVELEWQMDSTITQYGSVYGLYEQVSGSTQFWTIRRANTSESLNFLCLGFSNITIDYTAKYKVHLEAGANNNKLYINDELSQTGTDAILGTYTRTLSPYLFAINNCGAAVWHGYEKIYSFKQWRDGTLMVNFIPAKNSLNVLGMYDTVNDVFYTNSGTGTFTAGPEVNAYKDLNELYKKSANLFDKDTMYFFGRAENDGKLYSGVGYLTIVVPVKSSTTYTVDTDLTGHSTSSPPVGRIIFFDEEPVAGTTIGTVGRSIGQNYPDTLTTLSTTKYVAIWLARDSSVETQVLNSTMFVLGSTAPTEYIPYGYQYIGEAYKKNSALHNLPSGYTELDYVQANENQYINLNYTPIDGDNISYKFAVDSQSSYQCCLGSSITGFGRLQVNGTTTTFRQFNKSVNSFGGFTYAGDPITIGYAISGTTVTMSQDGYTSKTFTYDTASSLYLCAGESSTSSAASIGMYGRVYGFSIVNNSTTVMNLIPCKNSSDVAGLYDIANNTFYPSNTSTAFIAGSEIEKYEHVFSGGYDTTLTTNPATTGVARAKPISYSISGDSKQESDLPSGYTQLEYLESTGTQYIDTGYNLITSTDTISITVENLSTYNHCWNFGCYPTPAFGFSTGVYGSSNNIGYGSLHADTTHAYETGKHTWVADSNGFSVDGTNLCSYVSFTSLYNIYLFGICNAGSAENMSNCKIYNYIQTRDDVEILNLIPAKRNSDNVLGMYDLVSGDFFTNSGSGTFTAGPEAPCPALPEGVKGVGDKCNLHPEVLDTYTELQYIQSTSAQYINTGVDASSFPIDIDMTFAVTGAQAYGSVISNQNGGSEAYIVRYESATGHLKWYVRSASYDLGECTLNQNYHMIIHYESGASYLTLDGVKTTDTTTWSSGFSSTFAINSGVGSSGGNLGKNIIYNCTMAIASSNVRKYIPAKRNSDSVLGMYDTVNDVFYTNSGTGTFIAGPEAYAYKTPLFHAQNCGKVDLGTLTWSLNTTAVSGITLFTAVYTDKLPGVTNMFCSDYPLSSSLSTIADKECYGRNANSTIYFRNDSCSTAEDFKSAVSGVYLYYQRSTDTSWTAPTISNIYLSSPLSGISTYKDVLSSTGTLTRNIGIKVLDGTESWAQLTTSTYTSTFYLPIADASTTRPSVISTHYQYISTLPTPTSVDGIGWLFSPVNDICIKDTNCADTTAFKAFLAAQYAAGTPVTVYYPLATATTETVTVPSISTTGNVTNTFECTTEMEPSAVSWTYRKKYK